MGNYFRTPEMEKGGPFRCPNCNKVLAVKLKGDCLIQFKCPRCKAFISVKMNEPVNWARKPESAIKDNNHETSLSGA